MGNLQSTYEISVWKEVQTGSNFGEERVCVIGSDAMDFQGRAIEPTLLRKVNGEKSFSFKMYKQFTDNITGEKVINPFAEQLYSEAKVKLFYENKWYDFYVKNITEDSSTYLNTYQLNDALVQELSRNGYGVTFDVEKNNSLNTANGFAAEALFDIDWEVAEDSEQFVETIEEHLVYIKFSNDFSNQLNQEGYKIYKIYDQTSLTTGTNKEEIPQSRLDQFNNKTALAFYSSTQNKPHYFQFIFLSEQNYNREDVKNNDGIIEESNCQYIYTIPQVNNFVQSGQFYLPAGISIIEKKDISFNQDTTISTWFKGKRYGYSIQTKYVPQIQKYCGEYEYSSERYYGYLDSEYISPTLIQNVITNSELKGTTGWVGTYKGEVANMKSTTGAILESTSGYFNNNNFYSAIEDLISGTYDKNETEYKSYLKFTFPKQNKDCYPLLINSGFYDNRNLISIVQNDEEWILDLIIRNSSGAMVHLGDNFQAYIAKAHYETSTGAYEIEEVLTNSDYSYISHDGQLQETRFILTFNNLLGKLTSEDFKKLKLYLIIEPKNKNEEQTFYLEKAELYPKVENDGVIMKPGTSNTQGKTINRYNFILKSTFEDLDNPISSLDECSITTIKEDDLDYSIYKPIYNEGAEKVRTLSIKESNYFNILQSIAETFECWLDLEIKRDPNIPGKITQKLVRFKNYAGNVNYAGFRYGVNLKDIKRTYESKELTTKLIVKQNNNELGKSDFCTIARAGSNPTGENYIYDFQYFHKLGLLDDKQYLADLYYDKNPINGIQEEGPDVRADDEEYNLQNYFNRIKHLNVALTPINEDIVNLTTDLTKLQAEKTVQEGLRDSAAEGISESSEKFFGATGLYPDQISVDSFSEVKCYDGTEVIAGYHDTEVKVYESAYDYKNLNSAFSNSTIDFKDPKQIGGQDSTHWQFQFKIIDDTTEINCEKQGFFTGNIHGSLKEEGNEVTLTCQNKYDGIQISPESGFEPQKRYCLSYSIYTAVLAGDALTHIGSHLASFKKAEIYVDGKKLEPSNGAVNLKNALIEAESESRNWLEIKIYGTYFNNKEDQNKGTNYLYIQPNRGKDINNMTVRIQNIKLEEYNTKPYNRDVKFYIQPIFECIPNEGNAVYRSSLVTCTIPAYSLEGQGEHILTIVDPTSSTLQKLLNEYITYNTEYNNAVEKLPNLEDTITDKQGELEGLYNSQQGYLDHKKALNKLFYTKYSRFIQEGTWMSEDYVDDDKYYNDALSVLQDSCWPKVTYQANTVAINKLPGYENFRFELGDSTFAEDPDFFGDDLRVEVNITEISENLDDASKSTLKLQTFKDQFRDLFQRITATVQQTQYNTGAYQKAVELAEADAELKSAFLQAGLQDMSTALALAGQTTVVQDINGITLTDSNTNNQMRLIGGAILMNTQDQETGERKWKTGLTPEGINASMITAGTVNTGVINIQSGNENTFRWDSFGINAFEADWTNGFVNRVNPNKFVRFDKHGIYGIDGDNNVSNIKINGESWIPESIHQIQDYATFALTWEGLKVTGHSGIVNIGRMSDAIIKVNNGDLDTFLVDTNGNVTVRGNLEIGSGVRVETYANSVANTAQSNAQKYAEGLAQELTPLVSDNETFSWKFDTTSGFYMYNGKGNVQTVEEVFKIYKPTSSDGYIAWLKGQIEADSGKIGGWEIKPEVDYYPPSLYYDGRTYHPNAGIPWSGYEVRISAPIKNATLDTKKMFLSVYNAENGEYPFVVYGNGALKATGVDLKGVINAESGYLGNWELKTNYITHYGQKYNNTNQYSNSFGLSVDQDQDFAISIGLLSKTDWTTGNFRVTHSGKLYAKDAEIVGTIETSDKDNIAKVKIQGASIQGGYPQFPDLGFFQLDYSELLLGGSALGGVKLNPGNLLFYRTNEQDQDLSMGQIISGHSNSGMTLYPGGNGIGSLANTWEINTLKIKTLSKINNKTPYTGEIKYQSTLTDTRILVFDNGILVNEKDN